MPSRKKGKDRSIKLKLQTIFQRYLANYFKIELSYLDTSFKATPRKSTSE